MTKVTNDERSTKSEIRMTNRLDFLLSSFDFVVPSSFDFVIRHDRVGATIMRMVFIGPPGAGKGTQAERLVKTYKMAHLSTGDMLRAARDAKTDVGVKADKFMSSGALVPDDIIVAIIAERLAQAGLPKRIPSWTVFRGPSRRPRRSTRCWPRKGRPWTSSWSCRCPRRSCSGGWPAAAAPTTRPK